MIAYLENRLPRSSNEHSDISSYHASDRLLRVSIQTQFENNSPLSSRKHHPLSLTIRTTLTIQSSYTVRVTKVKSHHQVVQTPSSMCAVSGRSINLQSSWMKVTLDRTALTSKRPNQVTWRTSSLRHLNLHLREATRNGLTHSLRKSRVLRWWKHGCEMMTSWAHCL